MMMMTETETECRGRSLDGSLFREGELRFELLDRIDLFLINHQSLDLVQEQGIEKERGTSRLMRQYRQIS